MMAVPKLAFKILDSIQVARSTHLGVEDLGIAQVVSVNAETAQSDSAEFLVADSDRVSRAPVLVRLYFRREEVHVRLERRLKCFVPVSQIRQDGQSVGGQLIQSRLENIGELAFVDEDRQL